jgi:hypothetical protein
MSVLTNKGLARAFALALTLWVLPVSAGQSSGVFNVNINLRSVNAPSVPKTGFCTKDPGPLGFGATLIIVCSTGETVDIAPGTIGVPRAPMQGGAYHYVFQATGNVSLPSTIDSYVGAGNVTSWRIVNLLDRDYLEMLVGW